ncbi:hypothetical protein [Bacillus sp. COPE52]|uniref:hypothetical protein n=1 Tax=Bacillus sp. COPE52 TaxID=2233998 RepID=UPI000E10C88D|nr:hypothetical protein [Bacillus sp. COPE52]AXK19152.1 hypothetical protein DPQ31_16210 [Bacillus sp. COPE52]
MDDNICIELVYGKFGESDIECVIAIEHFETWDDVWEHPTHDSDIQQILYLPVKYKCWGKGI